MEHFLVFNSFEKHKQKNVEIFGINSIRQKQIAIIFIIFTKMKMLNRQSLENIGYFRTFFASSLQPNPVWLESCTPIGNAKKKVT